MSAAPLRDAGGALTGAIAAHADIDQQKRHEASLRASETLLRKFADHSTSVLWIFDLEQNALEYLSPAFERIWGRLREAMLQTPGHWAETIHPDDRPGARDALEQVLKGGAALTHEFRIIRPDGSVRWIRDTCFPIRRDGEPLQQVAGIAHDITRDTEALVYLVGADPASCERLSLLLRGANYRVQEFVTARAFLEVAPVLAAGCVLLNAQPSVASAGVTLLQEMKVRQIGLPVVVTGGHPEDVGLAVCVMKAGAVEYLVASDEDPELLLMAVAAALADIRNETARGTAVEHARKRIAALSAREREVLQRLLIGATNKQVGKAMGISPRTVEIHRAHVIERIGAHTLPEAALLATTAGLKPSWFPKSSK